MRGLLDTQSSRVLLLLPCNASNCIGYVLPVAKLAFSNQGDECVPHFFHTESLNQLAKLFLGLRLPVFHLPQDAQNKARCSGSYNTASCSV
jgi:hypothetical protein